MKYLDLPNDKLIERVEEDMEFIQLLSNPEYIQFLIENKYFDDENFLYYLKYLEYIPNSSLLKFVKYPICLKMLENIQNPKFVSYWADNSNLFTNYVNGQLFGHYIDMSKPIDKDK